MPAQQRVWVCVPAFVAHLSSPFLSVQQQATTQYLLHGLLLLSQIISAPPQPRSGTSAGPQHHAQWSPQLQRELAGAAGCWSPQQRHLQAINTRM